MRRKPLPPPPDDPAAVETARRAVPLVPGSEDDCCARLQGRLDLPGRDDAATWLAFLEALGLAVEGERGFARVRGASTDRGDLAVAFLDGIYGAREVRDALADADGPLDADAAFAVIADLVPGWERHRHGEAWRTVWRDRTADVLAWLALLGLAVRADGGYRSAATE